MHDVLMCVILVEINDYSISLSSELNSGVIVVEFSIINTLLMIFITLIG